MTIIICQSLPGNSSVFYLEIVCPVTRLSRRYQDAAAGTALDLWIWGALMRAGGRTPS
jgi:hypothetical protein